VVLTVSNSFLRQSSLVFTNVAIALKVFLNVMRYINPCFTYLPGSSAVTAELEQQVGGAGSDMGGPM